MNVYGYENRKWKMDGSKLIRYSEKGEELYFYDLPDFNKSGLVAWYKGLMNFNLVNNKIVINLNLYQKWKLYTLIEDKFNEIQRLNRVKEQITSVSKTIGKRITSVGKGLVSGSPLTNLVETITSSRDEEFFNVRDTWREQSVTEHQKAMINSEKRGEFKSSPFRMEYEETLRHQLETQKALDERGHYMKKSSFQLRLEEKANELRDRSISKKDLMDRNARIQDRITKLEERFNNG